ncbi:SGNH/GDSL hydrolase family protein [Paenibacillus sp. 1P07SE]|uniref:SGNH/GDSL hydrolase family protein n=1 Tax=Paenibacillus sp. 1P07SE TaxID=3132209 RepID=UPI0039A6A243
MRDETWDTLVFIGTEEQKLRLPAEYTIRCLRSYEEPAVIYGEGVDYGIDRAAGTIRRLPGSAVPDWRGHPHYGLEGFDHRETSGYSNAPYTCILEYAEQPAAAVQPDPPAQLSLFTRLHARLAAGEPVTYVAYGDSISAGYEASRPEAGYVMRLADTLRARSSSGEVALDNRAKGGESSGGGLQRLRADVASLAPDLVSIAYGMNDQNRQPDGGNATPLAEFEGRLIDMVQTVREHTEAEVLLITPCLPNPRWALASANVRDYAEVIRRIGRELEVPVADVQILWEQVLAEGKSHESLLLNNLNHPNDYGHALYLRAASKCTF